MSDFTSKTGRCHPVGYTPAFIREKHIDYIKKLALDTTSFEFVISQNIRMNGIYWALTSLYILGCDLHKELDIPEILDWVMKCQHEKGGFGGNINHDPHIIYTLSALQILSLVGELHRIDKASIKKYIKSLQRPDGSFCGDIWGEIDTRFSYCALSSLAILGSLREELDNDRDEKSNYCIDVKNAVEFISSCQNFDGGFGAVPSAESHAGQIFCCVGALSICDALHIVRADLLGWWLAERQCDSGGLNGRPEKQADVCYSWWILSCLSIMGRLAWINEDKLISFILECQDADGGGFSDRPGNSADIFHTFFGICGLHLLGYFKDDRNNNLFASEGGTKVKIDSRLHDINPTYALPWPIVEALNLTPVAMLPEI